MKGKLTHCRKERTENPFEVKNARSFHGTDKLECQHDGALENLINSDIKFTPKCDEYIRQTALMQREVLLATE